ncbi:MAG TPA: hypothetical protein VHN79_09685 [Lacunisphaera sp.]|nr:hypothetical protein [Lacunisphaera sp.]
MEIPRFEILSRCNDLTTEQLALAFHRANQLLGLVLPARFQLTFDAPQTLIFYDEKLWPVAEQQAVATMLRANPPARPDAGLGSAAPPRVRLEPLTGSQFLGLDREPRTAASHAFFSNLMLTDADVIVTFVLVSTVTIDPQRSYLTPAYVGNLLQNRTPGLPDWFTAGFMRLYDRMNFEANTVTVKPLRWDTVVTRDGRATDSEPWGDVAPKPRRAPRARRALELGQQPLNLPQTEPGHQFGQPALTNPKDPAPERDLLLPLAGFVAGVVPADDLDSWLTQAELLVSWGLDPANGRVEAFWNWIDRVSTEPATEALFQECLDLNFAAATRSIVVYSANHRGIRWVLPENLANLPPLPLYDASAHQIARIKGEWERLEARYVRRNQPDLEKHYLTLARRTLRKPYDRGDRDPRLLASLGLLELEAGDQAAARSFLEAAVQGGVVRPRAYYALARLRYDHLVGRSTRNDGKYTSAQTAPILLPLLAATKQTPPLSAVYELMAHVCCNLTEPPSDEVLAALAEGVRLFPGNDALRHQVAALRAGAGEPTPNLQLLPEPHARPHSSDASH